MPKKYLVVDNIEIAKQKSMNALESCFPNRHALQAAKHAEDPDTYPATCQTLYLNAWRQHKRNGTCELEIDDDEVAHYPGEAGRMKAARQIPPGLAIGEPDE